MDLPAELTAPTYDGGLGRLDKQSFGVPMERVAPQCSDACGWRRLRGRPGRNAVPP